MPVDIKCHFGNAAKSNELKCSMAIILSNVILKAFYSSYLTCIDFKYFDINSSNSSSLALIHTKFVADDKPKLPHADVGTKKQILLNKRA